MGSLTKSLDFSAIIEAARNSNFQFVIGGTGPIENSLRALSVDIPNIILPGWLSSAQAKVLADRSTLMIAPYSDLEDFSISLPNKFLDAMKFAKPIISSIPGYAAKFITDNGIGGTYSNSKTDSLINVLQNFFENPVAIQKASESSREIFERFFTFEKIYGDLVKNIELLSKNLK